MLDRLLGESWIDESAYERALHHAVRTSQHAEDAIIEIGAISEADLLKYLASLYRTLFVSTEKLAKAGVDNHTLSLVPKKVVDKLGVFPVLFNAKTQTLSVVAVAPDEQDLAKQVQLVAGVRDVKVYVARPAAVRAAIRKYYYGEDRAFAGLFAGTQISLPATAGGGNPQSWGNIDIGMLGTAAEMNEPAPQAKRGPTPPPGLPARGPTPPPLGLTRQPTPPPPRGPTPSGAVLPPPYSPPPPSDFRIEMPDVASPAGAAGGDGAITSPMYLQTLNVLVTLLENGRGELRGHTSQVARLTEKLCQRVGVPESARHGVLVAAYLHDLGKAGAYHLTALNVAQYEGHRLQAQKTYLTPIRLFESARLPASAVKTLTHLYERWDGGGFPDRLSGKDIPLGARVLAMVETYLDVTSNPRNPYRKVLSPRQGWEALAQFKGAIFDPDLVDLFRQEVLGDDLRAKLLADRATVLLVDPDAEETAVLEMRLIEHGFDVVIARDAADARAAFEAQDVDILVTEVDLQPHDGFEMLRSVRGSAKGASVPCMFLTTRSDRDTVNKGFELGAADFLVKPASADVVAAKVRQLLAKAQQTGGAAKRARGVTGTLREMALPDVVQILGNGRKTGKLSLTAGNKQGEIAFAEGQICDAKFGEIRGEDAFYAMLLLQDGDFSLEPDVRPQQRTIHIGVESLLLEGMRRMDEARK